MTDTANDLATLEQLHHELRIDGDGDDTALADVRAAAVSFVENRTGLPLLDRVIVDYGQPVITPRGMSFVDVRRRHVRSVVVAYWTDTQSEVWADPTGATTTGRIEPAGAWTRIWPPPAGWPSDRLPGSPLRLTLTVGVDATELVKRLVLASARHLWDGQPDVPATLSMLLQTATEYP